jgi:two-component system OmpR family sensor kinase
VTLRARLLLGLVILAALGLGVAGAITYREVGNSLVKQRDQQLQQAMVTLQPEDLFSLPAFRGRPSPAAIPAGTCAELVDASGTVLAGPTLFDYRRESLPNLPDRVTVGDKFVTKDPHFRGTSKVTQSGAILVLALSMRDADQTLHKLLVVELVVAALVLLALAMLAYWVVKLGLRPLESMQVTAGAIAAGDLSQRVDVVDENTEVGKLGLALNEMLQQIETAFAERAASEERLRRFVGDASHELRTPLTSIRGYAELFRRGAADRPEDLAKTMRRIEEEADRMGIMVDDLLLLARLDQGRPLEREPVDLTRITTDAVDDTRAVAPDRTIEYAPNGAITVTGDEARLRQVLGNLLQNAIRHTPPETPVRVRVIEDGDDAVLEVADWGPGMSEQEAKRVFERFWRADASRTRASGGTGLGLAIVAAIADAHGGSATVETALGQGACFRVRLPRGDATAN